MHHIGNTGIDGYQRGRILREAARRMHPDRPDTPTVDGRHSTTPLTDNTWGNYATPGTIHFHRSGVTGRALDEMGTDIYLDVDGQPLADVVGRIATDVDACRISPQEGVTRFVALRDRMPHGSRARTALTNAVSEMACPEFPAPPIDQRVPEPIRALVTDLHNNIPFARIEPTAVQKIVNITDRWADGDPTVSGLSLISAVEEAGTSSYHESHGDRGARAIKHRILDCVEQLRAMRTTNRTALYPPTM